MRTLPGVTRHPAVENALQQVRDRAADLAAAAPAERGDTSQEPAFARHEQALQELCDMLTVDAATRFPRPRSAERPSGSATVVITIEGHDIATALQPWCDMMIGRLQLAEHHRDRARELAVMLWPHVPDHVQTEIRRRLGGEFPTWIPKP